MFRVSSLSPLMWTSVVFVTFAIGVQAMADAVIYGNVAQPSPGPQVQTSAQTQLPAPSIRSIQDGPGVGQVTIQMNRPFTDLTVDQLANRLGTDVVNSVPSFGIYQLALPRIQITISNSYSGTVFFPQ